MTRKNDTPREREIKDAVYAAVLELEKKLKLDLSGSELREVCDVFLHNDRRFSGA